MGRYRAAGRYARTVALVDAVPGRVLAVYAHPDDADISCGGTLARWAGAGSHVEVVIATTGDKGTSDLAADLADLILRRSAEVAESLGHLGVAHHQSLGTPDGEVVNDVPTRCALVALIRSVKPDVVVGPDPTAVYFGSTYVNHRDHRELGWALLEAVAPAAASAHYFPEAGAPHSVSELWLSGTLDADAHVDISMTLEAKVAAITCHRSQIGEPGEWVRGLVVDRAEGAGREVGVAAAESFRRMILG